MLEYIFSKLYAYGYFYFVFLDIPAAQQFRERY